MKFISKRIWAKSGIRSTAACTGPCELRDGHCDELLHSWEHDYHKKYAKYICSSEAQHPLLSWELLDWEDRPPLIILHYRGARQGGPGSDQSLLTLTTEHKGAEWVVTKYDAMY